MKLTDCKNNTEKVEETMEESNGQSCLDTLELSEDSSNEVTSLLKDAKNLGNTVSVLKHAQEILTTQLQTERKLKTDALNKVKEKETVIQNLTKDLNIAHEDIRDKADQIGEL